MDAYRDIKPGEASQMGDEHSSVQKSLTKADRQVAEQPLLKPVTPEAMAAIEERSKAEIVIFRNGSAFNYEWDERKHWSSLGYPRDRPERGLYIDASTVSEVIGNMDGEIINDVV